MDPTDVVCIINHSFTTVSKAYWYVNMQILISQYVCTSSATIVLIFY
jgi:hypothetical protein